ncbi:MAG TPA: CAP domain-containing protein [Steroidobacteraceae bacterium]|nr:CAP domain-containing protein [Steroidobacteraceae bacterium]
MKRDAKQDMSRTRRCLGLIAVVAVGWAHTQSIAFAQVDFSTVVDLTNDVRMSGCAGRAGVGQPLSREPKLAATAEQIAGGMELERALAASDYRARSASVLEIEAHSGIGAVERFLQERFCETVTDPSLEHIGTASRGHTVWIVLAAPLVFPDEIDRATVRDRVLDLTNQARARARRCGRERFEPAPPLQAAAALDEAASVQAEYMANRGELSHIGPNGSNVQQRVTHAGYLWRAVAENIAEGQPDAYVVVRDWLDSPEHCANLMDPRYTQMGSAFAIREQGVGQSYWVQVFATPRQ